MTFATFMDLALYHPEGGYYTRSEMKVGKGGDFYTSPTIQAAFGTCMARQIVQGWELMGRPTELSLLELGAGGGQLAHQVLSELSRYRRRWKKLRYAIWERSGALRDRQAALLSSFASTVHWIADLEELAPEGRWEGIVFSNELFDALPFHRVAVAGGQLVEIGVHFHEGSWRQVAIPPSTPRLLQVLSEEGISLQEGQQAEVGLAAQDLMERLGRWLGRALMLTVDYGGSAEQVYASHRKRGSLRSYYHQLLVPDPLACPGEQDLTADVDFTGLMAAGERGGLRTLGVVPQGEFLKGLGIQALEQEAIKEVESRLEASQIAFDFRRLYEPQAMGDRFLVLLQIKAVDITTKRLAGLGGEAVSAPSRHGFWPWK